MTTSNADAFMRLSVAALRGHAWSVSQTTAAKLFGGAIRAQAGPALERAVPYGATGDRVGSVVVLRVWGLIGSPQLGQLYGWLDYETLLTDLEMAVHDPNVSGVILDFDSDGGACTGGAEATSLLAALSERHSIVAYVSGAACGAAYWLASACSQVIAAETAVLGELGVQFAYVDDSAALDRAGLRRITVVSSQTPQKNRDPAEEDGRRQWQQMADDVAAVMLRDVAAYRGVDPARVAETFGAGRMLVGARAVAAGLADSVRTQREVIRDIRRGRDFSRTSALGARGHPNSLRTKKQTAASGSRSSPQTTATEQILAAIRRFNPRHLKR